MAGLLSGLSFLAPITPYKSSLTKLCITTGVPAVIVPPDTFLPTIEVLSANSNETFPNPSVLSKVLSSPTTSFTVNTELPISIRPMDAVLKVNSSVNSMNPKEAVPRI